MQKGDTLRKIKQQKISDTWKKLPEHERRHFLAEEDRLRRFALREAQIKIWKKWRSKDKNTRSQPDRKKCPEDARLERLEEILERMKTEVKKRNEAKIVEEERRNKLIEEKKLKQEKMLRQEQKKKNKIIKKKMLEERWEMTKWITKYIDESEGGWAREKKEREENVKKWQEDGAR